MAARTGDLVGSNTRERRVLDRRRHPGGTDPINIDWEDAEAVMTVIICNSSFDVNGDPSIEIDTDERPC